VAGAAIAVLIVKIGGVRAIPGARQGAPAAALEEAV